MTIERTRGPRSSKTSRWVPLAVAAACFGAVSLAAGEARAQAAAAEPNQVTGTAKGIVGGALLGGEIVMIPMGAAGLKPWWPYLVFGGLGSVGGAVGGWAVEQAAPPAEAPLYMLAGGLALIIPTVVLSAAAITHEEYEDTGDPSTQPPPPDEGQPGAPPAGDGTTVTVDKTSDARRLRRRRPTPSAPPSALFDVARGEVRMGLPAVVVRNMYTLEEQAIYGVEQKTEVHVPVVGAAF